MGPTPAWPAGTVGTPPPAVVTIRGSIPPSDVAPRRQKRTRTVQAYGRRIYSQGQDLVVYCRYAQSGPGLGCTVGAHNQGQDFGMYGRIYSQG